jgi:hypothetical protein
MERINRQLTNTTISQMIGPSASKTLGYFQATTEPDEVITAKTVLYNKQRFCKIKPEFQEKLIDSIMENVGLPMFYLARLTTSTGKTILEVIDGQHRLVAMQNYLLDKFTWNGCKFSELDPEAQTNFLAYPITLDISENPSQEQKAEIFQRINSGKPLNDNDKFYNYADSPVIQYIFGTLIPHPKLKNSFKEFAGITTLQKSRTKISYIVGAVTAILCRSVNLCNTSYEYTKDYLNTDITDEASERIIRIFDTYFSIIRTELKKQCIKKVKKDYLKLSKSMGIFIFWYLNRSTYLTTLSMEECIYKLSYYIGIMQNAKKTKEIFASLSSGQQRNSKEGDLEAKTNLIMKLSAEFLNKSEEEEDAEDADEDDDEDDS